MHFVQKLINRLGSMVTEFSDKKKTNGLLCMRLMELKQNDFQKLSNILQISATRHQCKP
jgi:hypothetical protein